MLEILQWKPFFFFFFKKHILIKYKIKCQMFGSETIKDYFFMFHRSFHRLKQTSDYGMW
jgi:hypothetical protein